MTRLRLEKDLEEKRVREEHERMLRNIEQERNQLEEETELLREEERRRLEEAAAMRNQLKEELTEQSWQHHKAVVGDSISTIKRKANLNLNEIKRQRTQAVSQTRDNLRTFNSNSNGEPSLISNAIEAQDSIYEMEPISTIQ